MIMARNEDGTYSQVGFVKDNAGIDTEYIYDKDGDIVFEKGFTRETSGTVPLTINGIGKDLKAWSITGNTVQNGTPTPENPIEVQAVGDRTGNLFKAPKYTSKTENGVTWESNGDGTITVSGTASGYSTFMLANAYHIPSDCVGQKLTFNYSIGKVSNIVWDSIVFFDENNTVVGRYSTGKPGTATIEIESNFKKADVSVKRNNNYEVSGTIGLMINEGSTALPYEPYGYKIPVVTSADGTEPITTPIYLPTPLYSGEVMRSDGSREVKFGKLVLTGSEKWSFQSINSYGIANFYIKVDKPFVPSKAFSTHFSAQNTLIGQTTNEGVFLSVYDVIYIRIKSELADTVSRFESYLKEQYTAGTPVTVWYPLAEPTTETFTAPQIPTLNDTTVIDVDTAVKPTEMYTKYKSSK